MMEKFFGGEVLFDGAGGGDSGFKSRYLKSRGDEIRCGEGMECTWFDFGYREFSHAIKIDGDR